MTASRWAIYFSSMARIIISISQKAKEKIVHAGQRVECVICSANRASDLRPMISSSVYINLAASRGAMFEQCIFFNETANNNELCLSKI